MRLCKPGARLCAVDGGEHGAEQDVVHESGLSRPRHARDRDQATEGERNVDVAQVVLARSSHDEVLSRPGSALVGDGYRTLAGQVLAGERFLRGEEPGDLARVHDRTAVLAGSRPDVHHVVRLTDRLLVVLDDDDGVAEIAEADEGVEQPAVVALVKPDRRLVEDVEHPDESRTDLAGEPDPLCLTAGQRGRTARERQIVESYVQEELASGP